jgi:hypothetical protein
MKRTTHIIIALALGMLIGSAATAFADDAIEKVTATVAKFRFVVNGEERDVQTEQLVVMGTTYLPVREVANMLGYDVVYRSDSKTVEFLGPVNTNVQRGASEVTDTIIETTWIDLNTLAREYGVRIEVGENLRIGDFVVARPAAEPDRVAVIETEHRSVRIKIESGRFYVDPDELKEAGIIQ